MEITKKDLEKQTKQIERYNKMLLEDYDSRIKIIGEGWSITDEKVDKIGKKLDATFDEVGNLKVKMVKIEMKITAVEQKITAVEQKIASMEKRIIKIEKDIEIMKLDIQFIKTDLKKFVRIEEFEALEKRVISLENK